MTWDCPDCDESAEEEQDIFLHRIRTHTDADTSDGSFNIHNDEIWSVYVEMVREEARSRIDGKPTTEKLALEMEEMGVPTLPNYDEFSD